MKNHKYSIRLLLWLFLILLGFGIKAQVPTYNCRITNAAQVSCNVWEFDVVLQRTGFTVFKMAQFQLGINMNPAVIPSGAVINVTPVPGSSQLNALQQPGPEKFYYDTLKNCIMVFAVAPPGAAGASTISNLPAGTRLTRIRVGSTIAYNSALTPDPTWCFTLATSFQTKMFAYVGTTNTNVTVQASHTYVAPSNPTFTGGFPDPLAQTVTSDVTEYCNLPGQGALISLASTQAGYTYYLYSNGTQVSGVNGVLFGTGAAATFGAIATGSAMSVKSPSCSGMADMLNTISLTPADPVVPSVTITASPATVVPPGTSVTFIATPVNGGTPAYLWFVNGVPDLENGFDQTYTYTPVNGDQFYCEMYPSDICVQSSLVTSNVITFGPYECLLVPIPVIGGGTYCQGEPGVPVGLPYSEPGITYTLYKNGVAQDPTIVGTGGPISFTNQTTGVYTIIAGFDPNCYLEMPGSVTVAETLTQTVSVEIYMQNNPICMGHAATFSAIPNNGGTPTYQWYVNGLATGTNQDTFSYIPFDNDSVYVLMSSSLNCVSGNPVASNIVNLVVYPSDSITFVQTNCDTFTWNGVTYNSSGIYSAFFPGGTIYGCDSTATLSLTINNSSTSTTTETACNSYSWNGNTYNTSGTYTTFFPGGSMLGCDSTATLNLVINHDVTSTTDITACNSYTWNGNTYNTSGTYTAFFPGGSGFGCDSSATLNLAINIDVTSTSDNTACNSYTWNGNIYNTSGTYTAFFPGGSGFGCDSTATLNLVINHDVTSTTDITTCNSYTWNGNTYNTSGTYTAFFPGGSGFGCDSSATLNLIINIDVTSTSDNTACNSYTWNGNIYNTSGTYTAFFPGGSMLGCDSTATLNLVINHDVTSTTDITACNSYTWNGNTYNTSGTYAAFFLGGSGFGCDSTATLNLVINIDVTSTTDITACNSYTWNGNTYSTSGTFTAFFPGGSRFGCDSTSILELIINPLPNPELFGPVSLCQSENYAEYYTQGFMTNYNWSVSGGIINMGGGITDSIIHITWINAENHQVEVNYENPNGCEAANPAVLVVDVDPMPALFSITGGGNYCIGGNGVPVGLSGSQIDFDYQLRVNGIDHGTAIPGTGNAIDFGLQMTPGVYTILATGNLPTACSTSMIGSTSIIITPQSIGGTITGGGTIYEGNTSINLILSGYTGSILKWQKRLAQGTWIDIPNTTQNLSDIGSSAGSWYYRAVVQNGVCSSAFSTEAIVTVLSRTFLVKVYFEGLFNSSTGMLNKAQDVNGDKFPGDTADLFTICLAHNAYPYNIEYEIDNIALPLNGLVTIELPSGSISAYFVVIKHRNSIETWSSFPISLNANHTTYNFTNGPQKAYGYNLLQIENSWVIYSGDINQDGLVDGSDMAAVDNASTITLQGYSLEDLNVDGLVDGSDMAIIDNNATELITSVVPF